MGRAAIALGLAILCVFDADVASAAGAYPLANSAGNTQVLIATPDSGAATASPSSISGDGCSTTMSFTATSSVIPASGHHYYYSIKSWNGAPGSASGSWTAGATQGGAIGVGDTTTAPFSTFSVTSSVCTSTVDVERVDLCIAALDVTGPSVTAPGVCSASATLAVHYQRASQFTAPPDCSMPAASASYVSGDLAVLLSPSGGSTAVPAGGWRVDNPKLVPDGSGNVTLPATPKLTITAADQVPGRNAYFDHVALGSISGNTVTVSAINASGTADCWVQVPVSLTVPVTSGTGTDAAGDGETDCGFSLNIAHDIKCALCWAFCPGDSVANEWSGLRSDFEETGPGSVAVSGAAVVGDVVTALSGIGGGADSCVHQGVTCIAPFSDGNGNALDFTSPDIVDYPGYSAFYFVLEAVIYISASIIIWGIARANLGGKA